MSKIKELKQKMYKKNEQAILEEALSHLEKASKLEKEGNTIEANLVVNDLKEWLQNIIQKVEKNLPQDGEVIENHYVFPQEGKMVALGNLVRLDVIRRAEKEEYLSVVSEYYPVKKITEDEKFREETWKEFLGKSSFVCSIYDRDTNKYVGYCSVRNMDKEAWELAIELKPDACHKGYGTEALVLLMRRVYELTGNRYYRARVEVDNHASQGLMRKLGATPNGIREFLLYGDDIEKFQEENKYMITDEIRQVAAEFCMDAEDILGYVLEYRFDAEKL